ncbi:Rad52/Rad22 family DNA repair protein [Aestuariivirga sp.]|uniref:Rad52/Rad22 family DNA repair protein n=1 Tax=Aestuariivirga sp. TaxID=2650926 RepID=UPI00359396E7
MSFTPTQRRQLRARLNPDHVRSRVAEGQILSFLEGWHVIAEANRIFGFEGWDRETLASTCVYSKQIGDRYCAAYAARVRITVRAGERTIIREGSGAGEANVASPGQAHEVAAKAAETDATKRALMTFGNAFGLAPSLGSRDLPPPRPAPRRVERPRRAPGQRRQHRGTHGTGRHRHHDPRSGFRLLPQPHTAFPGARREVSQACR